MRYISKGAIHFCKTKKNTARSTIITSFSNPQLTTVEKDGVSKVSIFDS
jgi:hypothetical protein